MKVRPNDKDAKAKYTECNKIVKMAAFARAIAVDDEKSIADTLDIASMCESLYKSISLFSRSRLNSLPNDKLETSPNSRHLQTTKLI